MQVPGQVPGDVRQLIGTDYDTVLAVARWIRDITNHPTRMMMERNRLVGAAALAEELENSVHVWRTNQTTEVTS